MIALKIHCPCGQHFVFDIEPVDNRMPCAVACPGCGVDSTALANAQIRAQLTPATRPDRTNLLVMGMIVAIVFVISASATAIFYLKSHPDQIPEAQATEAATVTTQPVATAEPVAKVKPPTATEPEPSASVKNEPAGAANPETTAAPAKTERDPSLVAVGALFLRNTKTEAVEITRVIADSPAAKAGIVAGMILTKVNDKPIQNLSVKAIADMFYGKVGTKIRLELIKPESGETKKVKLVRKGNRK